MLALLQVLGGIFSCFILLHVDGIYKTQRADFPLMLTAQVVTKYRIQVERVQLNDANIFVKRYGKMMLVICLYHMPRVLQCHLWMSLII